MLHQTLKGFTIYNTCYIHPFTHTFIQRLLSSVLMIILIYPYSIQEQFVVRYLAQGHFDWLGIEVTLQLLDDQLSQFKKTLSCFWVFRIITVTDWFPNASLDLEDLWNRFLGKIREKVKSSLYFTVLLCGCRSVCTRRQEVISRQHGYNGVG